ncbi:MAG TPA: ribosome-associated translation inhibitor RaiA [Candidatus Brocadiales bacterium]|nr:ribosome-associated translation inhibitor RaiA [Candidatus Brocadiales bacterium]
MDITISGRHLNVTEAMKDYARKKAAKLERFFDRIRKIQVTLDVEGERQIAEMIVSAARGSTLIAEVSAADMYAAIDLAVDKLEKQLIRHKEKLYNRRNRQKGFVPEIEEGTEPMASDIT